MHYFELYEQFRKAWPTTYGGTKKERDPISGRSLQHGKDLPAKTHRMAFDRLIRVIWPVNTGSQFFGLRATDERSDFHSRRFELAVYLAEGIWKRLSKDWPKPLRNLAFDKNGVTNFLKNVVSEYLGS